MTEKELLSALLSKTLNMDTNGVASLYNEDGTELKPDALETLTKLDVERVAKLKPDTKKIFDDGYKKATSEILSSKEKEFKEKTGFVSDKTGIELYLEYAQAQSKAEGAITDDAVKKHPLFISTVDRLSKEKQDAVTAESEKLTKFQTELVKKETYDAASKKGLEIFASLKPILSTDPVKAKAQEELFLDKLKAYEIEKQGENFIILKDGKVLEDNHGHRISFETITKDITNRYFDLHKAEPRGSAGNGKPDPNGAGGQALQIPVFKSESEYNQFIGDSTKPLEVRVAAQAAREAQGATS